MVKQSLLLFVLCVTNSIAISSGGQHRKNGFDPSIDYKLEKPSLFMPMLKTLGFMALGISGSYVSKVNAANTAFDRYPNALKGAQPGASVSDKAEFEAAMSLIRYAPILSIVKGAIPGLAWGLWQHYVPYKEQSKLYSRNKTRKEWVREQQFNPEADKVLCKDSTWEKITTKKFAQILREDDAEHAQLWVKQNPQFKYHEGKDGRTFLHRAIIRNSLNVAKVLIDHGAKVDGFSKKPPLLIATQRLGLKKAHELIKNSRAHCACSH